MPRKTKIIFITTFIVVGVIILGLYFSRAKTPIDQSGAVPIYQRFNPFNASSTTGSTGGLRSDIGGDGSGAIDDSGATQANSKFHQLTDFSVAGAVYFQDTRLIPPTAEEIAQAAPKDPIPKFETFPALRYVERVTGHIYERALDTKEVTQVSNSTIPGIYEAFFDSKATTVIYRYLGDDNKTIASFMATLGAPKGEFLSSNITDINVSQDKSKFFYLTETSGGVTGTIRSFAETKKTQVFSSPFTEWLSAWAGDGKIYLTTKASYAANGNLFSLNTGNGTLTKVLGGIAGLTTLANGNGTFILYSIATTGGPKLSVFDVAKHTSADLSIYSLPEKCVWALDNINVYCAIPSDIGGQEYPDLWYQGITSFNDSFMKIDTSTLQIQPLANSNDGIPVDATHLFLDNTEASLFFINKKDSTLWSLDLN